MLADRFHHYVGVPPMHYLARWRMQLAAALLSGTNLSLALVADQVGFRGCAQPRVQTPGRRRPFGLA
jgi:transcriptional regulator GlxA family with amidase domain